jgi:hypothetical protein
MIAPWAEEELSTVAMGDKRLDTRAVTLLSKLGQRPNLSIPAACGGRAETKAAYAFFDNDKVTFDKVLQPHQQRTHQRLAQQDTVLFIQDTTEIDLTRPQQQVTGGGPLDTPARRGGFLHPLHAFTPDGIPLGTAWCQFWTREEPAPDQEQSAEQKRQQRRETPIEDKESLRWLEGLRAARDLAQTLPGVQCICVADSEADVYELFAEERGAQPVAWLIRACQDRALLGSSGRHLRDEVLSTPVLYEVELKIRGRQAKTAVEDRARRQNRVTRQAKVEVRAYQVTLRPPWRPDRQLPAVSVNVVLVSEPNPPAGEPAVEWLLLTTLPIDTLEQVRTVVACYCVRWQVEILFRVLKSGCRIEARRFEDLERVLPCLAIYLIVAWRTLFVCHLGRECPDLDCEVIFEPGEWKAVWVAVHNEPPPPQAPPLAEMVHLIARLGGYVERRNSEPGPQTLWIGMQRMYDLAWAWECFGPGTKILGG